MTTPSHPSKHSLIIFNNTFEPLYFNNNSRNHAYIYFYMIWTDRNPYRAGFMHEMKKYLHEINHNWRRVWYYVKKVRKAIMTSWNRLRFFNFEKAWEVSNKTRYRKTQINKISIK